LSGSHPIDPSTARRDRRGGSSPARGGRLPSRRRSAQRRSRRTPVHSGRSGHHEVPVHESAEERGESREGAQDQGNADEQLAGGRLLGESGPGLGIEQRLHETPIPVECYWRAASLGGYDRIRPVALKRLTGLSPGRVGELPLVEWQTQHTMPSWSSNSPGTRLSWQDYPPTSASPLPSTHSSRRGKAAIAVCESPTREFAQFRL
jgi:hypothetical protein